jgi:hypothetical protein
MGLAVVVIVAAAITGLVIAGEDSDNDQAGDAAIEQFIPAEGAQLVQQAPIGIDLAPGYSGTLALNGVAIPEDELDTTPALNLVRFTPGPGKQVERYDEGPNCVLATFWLISDGPGVATSRYWCFTVL